MLILALRNNLLLIIPVFANFQGSCTQNCTAISILEGRKTYKSTYKMQNHLPDDLVEKVKKLEKKFDTMGQDLHSYLDGLLYADYLTYWDYVHLDVLLNLQTPRTPFKDETIFILYHQITELYFKLILHAIEQVANTHKIHVDEFVVQLERMNSYFDALISSFHIMIDGMDKDQFLKFRMSLLPASGFQSAQYRKIEICSSQLINLVARGKREELKNASLEQHYDNLYWKRGATELATGKKTLTLRQFEMKYREEILDLSEKYETKNICSVYESLSEEEKSNPKLIELLRTYDQKANVLWPMMHYRSASRYLNKHPEEIAATGGTNWQKYLPPHFQAIMFFPQLWQEEEIERWGKV